MSRLSDRKNRHDVFFKKARAEGFVARAVFKLEEVDRRFGLLRPGQRVLDLGCAPGSWLQYAAGRIGPSGRAVGINLSAVNVPLPAQAQAVVGDAFAADPAELRRLSGGQGFHAVVSDMAPHTTGIRSVNQAQCETLFERALDLGLQLLLPGGHFLGKIFQGPAFQTLRQAMVARFEEVKIVKPPASRKESPEIYLLGLRLRPPAGPPAGADKASPA